MSAPRGERHHNAKLTADDIRLIRALQGSVSSRRVGEKFGICGRTVLDIWERITWIHMRDAA
jgi:hypothetical protein